MRHSNIAVLVTHKTLNGKIIFFTAKPPLSNQDKAMENCTRLKVTTCLYRGPIINARSLSTFISVIVSKDAPTNSVDVNMDASRRWTQWFECSENHLHSLYVTCNGWVMRPIHKSEHARPPRRTFDGGWQQETFLRAAMIRAFSKNATIERGIFVTKDSIPRWSRSAVQPKASSIFVPLQTFVKFDMSFGYQPTLLISEMLHEKNVPNNSFSSAAFCWFTAMVHQLYSRGLSSPVINLSRWNTTPY